MIVQPDPINEKIRQAEKKFDGITSVLGNVLTPPNDLAPEKKGMLVSLALGILGIVSLSYVKAPWYAFVLVVVMAMIVAIYVGHKRKKNGKN